MRSNNTRRRIGFRERLSMLGNYVRSNAFWFCGFILLNFLPTFFNRLLVEGYGLFFPVGATAVAALHVGVIVAYSLIAVCAAVIVGKALYNLYKHFTAPEPTLDSTSTVELGNSNARTVELSGHPALRFRRSAEFVTDADLQAVNGIRIRARVDSAPDVLESGEFVPAAVPVVAAKAKCQ